MREEEFYVECIKDYINGYFHITKGATYLVKSFSTTHYVIVAGSNKNYLASKDLFKRNLLTIKCIDNNFKDIAEYWLTIGKEYIVLSESEDQYTIINDKDFEAPHHKYLFNVVETAPKRGDKVWVWMNNCMSSPRHLIFLSSIEGAYHPIICVRDGHEDSFRNNIPVLTCLWDNMSLTNPNLDLARKKIESLEAEIAEIKNKHNL